MRFYGIPPSELAAMDPVETAALSANMRRIRARERLEFITDVSLAMPTDAKGVPPSILELIEMAYPDDEISRAVLIESLTRK
jgi:hypothetical protein